MCRYFETWRKFLMHLTVLMLMFFITALLVAQMSVAQEWIVPDKIEFDPQNPPHCDRCSHCTDVNGDIIPCPEGVDPIDPDWEDFHHHRLSTAIRLQNGKVLICGGVQLDMVIDGTPYPAIDAWNKAWLYDPESRTVSPTGDMNYARTRHTAVLLNNGKVLIAGGYIGGGNPGILQTAELYDPDTGQFTLTGNLQKPRTMHTATLLEDGTVLIAGGWYNIGGDPSAKRDAIYFNEEAEIYDPGTGTFSYPAYPCDSCKMKHQRSSHTATRMADGRVLIWGGVDDINALSGYPVHLSGDVYDPQSKSFGPLVNSNIRRQSHSATLLKDGSVLIVAGWNGSTPEKSLGIVKKIWSCTGDYCGELYAYLNAPCELNEARAFQESDLLADGSVLITGGNNDTVYWPGHWANRHAASFLSSTEIFSYSVDPDGIYSCEVVAGPPMNYPRHMHSSTVLPLPEIGSQEVLVTGGVSNWLDLLVLADDDHDGVADAIDKCPETYNPGESQLQDSDNDGVPDACDNCPYTPNADQEDTDNDFLGDACDEDISNVITAASSAFYPGADFLVTATITNATGEAIRTFPPDCYNTYWSIPGAISPCRRGPAYGIPEDLITIEPGQSVPVTCNLNDMFEVDSLPTGVTTLSVVYENKIQDPDYDPIVPENCDNYSDDDCEFIWNGSVKATDININIITSTGDAGKLTVKADLHTVGGGSYPGSTKDPIRFMQLKLFSKSGDCVSNYGTSWQSYPDIYKNCEEIFTAFTDGTGTAVMNPPTGNYLVIGEYVIESETLYIGNSVGEIEIDDEVYKYLQVIKKADGKKVPAKYRKFTGSELLVIEPEYVEWSNETELYPFIFDSVGDWSVTTSVTPPEGFVADSESLGAEVNSELEAVQFTITDIGSKWVATKVKHKIKHKNKVKTVESEIGIKLSSKLAKKKGLGIYGEDDRRKVKEKK